MKVGGFYTTENGYSLRCISRNENKKGIPEKEDDDAKTIKWKVKPVYLSTFVVLDGPNKSLHQSQFKYYDNGLPVKRNELGSILGD